MNQELWHLEFVKQTDNVLYDNGHYYLGTTIPSIKTIFIANNIFGELLYRVICHEIAHAEFISRGLYIPIYEEECLADIVADNIVDVGLMAYDLYNNLN